MSQLTTTVHVKENGYPQHLCKLWEWFSAECCKTKPSNYAIQSQWEQNTKWTNQKLKQIQVISIKHGKTHARKSWLVLILRLIGWESGASFFNQSELFIRENVVKQNQSKHIAYDAQMKTALGVNQDKVIKKVVIDHHSGYDNSWSPPITAAHCDTQRWYITSQPHRLMKLAVSRWNVVTYNSSEHIVRQMIIHFIII